MTLTTFKLRSCTTLESARGLPSRSACGPLPGRSTIGSSVAALGNVTLPPLQLHWYCNYPPTSSPRRRNSHRLVEVYHVGGATLIAPRALVSLLSPSSAMSTNTVPDRPEVPSSHRRIDIWQSTVTEGSSFSATPSPLFYRRSPSDGIGDVATVPPTHSARTLVLCFGSNSGLGSKYRTRVCAHSITQCVYTAG